ncbi:hypothetical protein [Rhizobium sp. CECT 9324]|uniref:hypothetical protein n=1 Tax=Rhizobium sp. CECT 9324 TaxID=2845820 RepID=UPI001E6563EF|nr:hypothetical protein [Rhizobium sp. CECT 9324]CAH0343726.1 hypothetical protein RHI9324_05463 [Rhizobium sp. CECT 9324]
MAFDPSYSRPSPRKDQSKTPRVTADLVDWLQKTFPPMCIKENQSEISAHRYASQVELAQRIIGFARSADDHPGFSIQED